MKTLQWCQTSKLFVHQKMEFFGGKEAKTSAKSLPNVDWDYVNRELRHHGLSPVEFSDSPGVQDLLERIVLTSESSQNLLKTLASLLRDCDRRQDLIRDLITSNSALRNELKEQTSTTTDKYETLSRDLRVMLNSSQDKVQELENSLLNFSNLSIAEDEMTKKSASALESKCVQLSHLCATQEKEIRQLQEKIKKVNEENEKRNAQSQKIFSELKKSSRLINNEVILGLIDSYERKLHSLRRKLNYAKEIRIQDDDSNETGDDEIPDYKTIIKTYEKEQKILTKKLKTSENEREVLKLDLQSRPDMETYKEALHKIKKLERVLKAYKMNENTSKPSKRFSQLHEDLYSEDDSNRTIVQAVQEELKVDNLQDVILTLKSLTKTREKAGQLEKSMSETIKILFSKDDLLPPDLYSDAPFERRHLVWCEKTQLRVRQVVEHWQKQLCLLNKLQKVVNKLAKQTTPKKKVNLTGPVQCQRIISTLENLLKEQEEGNRDGARTSSPSHGVHSKAQLLEIVDHFMKLFSVKAISGIYPRMNDIYVKLGEVHNVMHTLKDVLGLDENEKNNVVIETVTQLSKSHQEMTTEQLGQLLQMDLDRLQLKLQEYEEFFPVFREVMAQLMEVLGLSRLDQVVPVVRSLKLANQ